MTRLVQYTIRSTGPDAANGPDAATRTTPPRKSHQQNTVSILALCLHQLMHDPGHFVTRTDSAKCGKAGCSCKQNTQQRTPAGGQLRVSSGNTHLHAVTDAQEAQSTVRWHPPVHSAMASTSPRKMMHLHSVHTCSSNTSSVGGSTEMPRQADSCACICSNATSTPTPPLE